MLGEAANVCESHILVALLEELLAGSRSPSEHTFASVVKIRILPVGLTVVFILIVECILEGATGNIQTAPRDEAATLTRGVSLLYGDQVVPPPEWPCVSFATQPRSERMPAGIVARVGPEAIMQISLARPVMA